MRTITVISMISLDGVLQAPGGPQEDTSGGFAYGGWVAPYNDAGRDAVFRGLMQPAELLLGRRTFDIWEHYWPQHEAGWPGVNDVTKYVVSRKRQESNWQNTVFLDSIEAVQALRAEGEGNLQVWGSGELIQALLAADLVDELWLLLHPLTLGPGKRLFTHGSIPAAFTLFESHVTATGVFMGHYRRAGAVQTGNLGAWAPEAPVFFGQAGKYESK